MIVAVASGKGGTGKTTVAVNLAAASQQAIQLLDCDVEEPNCHLFLNCRTSKLEAVNLPIPQVDMTLCTGCGQCARFCQYSAIAVPGKEPIIFSELCHGCGGCMIVCPQKAIQETPNRVGQIETAEIQQIRLIQGKLDVGATMASTVINALKHKLDPAMPAIIDASPGTSCPVIAAVQGADYVLLVTEPTPFGLHDLKLAVEMLRELTIPFGVVINRMGIGDQRTHRYCRDQCLAILLEIPDDRRIAEAYSRGELIINALPEYHILFKRLWQTLHESCPQDKTGLGMVRSESSYETGW